MSDHDKLGAMFAVMEEQQAAVQAAIAGLIQERKAIVMAIEALKGTTRTLQKATGDAAARAVVESIGEAPKTAAMVFNQAVGALNEAADQVRSTGTWLTFKATASIAGIGLVLVLAIYGLGRFMLPSDAERQEVQDLQAEKAQLKANIADLAKKGGRIKLTTCTDSAGSQRLCIPVARNQGQGYEKYTAPFSNTITGDQFVIPRGY